MLTYYYPPRPHTTIPQDILDTKLIYYNEVLVHNSLFYFFFLFFFGSGMRAVHVDKPVTMIKQPVIPMPDLLCEGQMGLGVDIVRLQV